MTFDFWPGWSLLDIRGRQNDKSNFRTAESVMVMFAIWDIGEFTEEQPNIPQRALVGSTNASTPQMNRYQSDSDVKKFDVDSLAQIEARRAKNAKRAAARKKAKKATESTTANVEKNTVSTNNHGESQ